VVGIALTVSTVFEAPVMLAANRLLARLGAWGALFLSLALIALRNLLYAQAADAGQIVLLQILHGLTYPLLWLAGVAFVAAHAPRGLNATAQGVFSAVLSSIGTAAGNYLCGWLIDHIGIRPMFNLVGWLGVGALIIFFVLSRLLRRRAMLS
jgi:PPP family 3-phenylpropionic acid transporter